MVGVGGVALQQQRQVRQDDRQRLVSLPRKGFPTHDAEADPVLGDLGHSPELVGQGLPHDGIEPAAEPPRTVHLGGDQLSEITLRGFNGRLGVPGVRFE